MLLRERQPEWAELDSLVSATRSRRNRGGSANLLRIATLYRSASADLVALRQRWPRDPRVEELTQIVTQAHTIVYGETEPAIKRGVVSFFTHRFWQLVRDRPRTLMLAVLLVLIPALLGALWAWVDPGQASLFAPGAIQAVTLHRAHGANLGIPTAQQSAFASTIFTHNILVALLAFAGGLTGGLLTAYLLITNGLLLGVFAGLAIGAGTESVFVQLVIPHGLLEMSCIAVSGTAGFRLARALIDPGPRTRAAAVSSEATAALELVAGVAVCLVVAGSVEGFVTPSGLGLGLDLLIGFGLFCIFWGLVLLRGAPSPSSADSAEHSPR
ncbi:MAG TPA: stage II sporulation protein M [Acidimicrobiales bacterium]